VSSPFRELGLADDLAAHLEANGITAPTPIQTATLPDMLAGRDVLAAAPTGSGKTVAFAAPLVARLGRGAPNRPAALVLTPTRELAAQIHDVLTGLCRVRDRWSATVYGGVRQGPQVNNLRRGVDVLVACPGRLEDLIEQGHVKLDRVKFVVIDEADRMSDMGFLPCVRRIVDQTSADRQTVLFSATLDGAADQLARTHLRQPVRHSVAAKEEDLGKATHLFWTADLAQRVDLSAQIVRRAGRTMLFTRTKHGADKLSDKLNALGVRAAVIHGGRSQSQRDKSLADFHRGNVAALVATDVAARGIHVEKVACVVHVDLPESPTDYQHRSGRTARAGQRGVVVSLVTPDQRRHARDVQRHFGFPSGHSRPDVDRIEPGEVPVVVEHSAASRTPRHDDRPQPTRGVRPPRRDDRSRPAYDRGDRPAARTERADRPAPRSERTDRPAAAAARDDRSRPTYDRTDRPAPRTERTDRPAARDDRGRPGFDRTDRPARRDERAPFARTPRATTGERRERDAGPLDGRSTRPSRPGDAAFGGKRRTTGPARIGTASRPARPAR
jgi:superfamily II DNA/RNA helicase